MSSLKEGISSILSKIAVDADGKSNNKAMMDMIKNTGVTESNVMEILGVIEQKTNDLIGKFIVVSASESQNKAPTSASTTDTKPSATQSNKQLDDKQAEAASLGIGIGAASLQPLVATPAAIFDDFSDEDEDNNEEEAAAAFAQESAMMHNKSDKK